MKLYWENGQVEEELSILRGILNKLQDPYSELEEHLALGVDGFFTDFPLTARRFLNYKGLLCGKPDNACPLS